MALHVVEEDVGVGADAVVQTSLAATGEGDVLRVGAPRQLLHAAERLHRALEGLALEHVGHVVAYFIVAYRTKEGVLDAFYVVVPVAIHQVGNQAACSFGQVGGVLLDDFVEGYGLQHDDLLVVGREEEALNLPIGVRQLAAVAAVGLHGPYFASCEEGYGLCVQPRGVGLRGSRLT